jgi:hypothetical protein
MSLFGKILAFLNVLGVFGVLALGLMTYSKKLQWQNACALQELMLTGLALDENQIDVEGFLAFENQSAANVKQLPGLQTGTVLTQIKAVEDAHNAMVEKTKSDDLATQIVAKARAAVPFTSDAGRYADLLLIQRWLNKDLPMKPDLKTQLKQAAADAEATVKDKGPMADRKEPRTFAEAFREFANIQPGLPKTPFVRAYLKAHANEPAAGFEALYGKMIEGIHQGVDDDLEYPYKAAMTGTIKYRHWDEGKEKEFATSQEISTTKPSGPGVQKHLIVRYLYNTIPTVATAEEQAVAQGDYAAPAVKRVVSIVGLEAFPGVLHEQAGRIGRMQEQLQAESGAAVTITSELAKQIERDRSEFTAQHSKLLEYLRSQAVLVADRNERLTRATKAANDQGVLVASSKAINDALQKDLDTLRADTLANLAEVRAYTKDFHTIQMKTRDAAELLQRLESEIRRRERLAP